MLKTLERVLNSRCDVCLLFFSSFVSLADLLGFVIITGAVGVNIVPAGVPSQLGAAN